MAVMATLCSLGDNAIEPLIRALVDPNEEVCRRASLALVTIGEPAVDPVIRALEDKSPGIRRELWRCSARSGTRRRSPLSSRNSTIPSGWSGSSSQVPCRPRRPGDCPAHAGLREGDMRTRTSAMEALWMLGLPATTPLIMVLKDEQVDVRKRAVLLLGEIGDQKAVDHLTGCLQMKIRACARKPLKRSR